MAIGYPDKIGIAWTEVDQGSGYSRRLFFAVSYDDGSTWSQPHLIGDDSLGGVDLSWSHSNTSWVVTWTSAQQDNQILTAMSASPDGQTWHPWRSYTSGNSPLVSPNLSPAIECHGSGDCLMVYRTFDHPWIKFIRQQAFSFDSTGLVTVPTYISTADEGFADLDVTYLFNSGTWLFTYPWPSTYEDALTYHVKTSGVAGSYNYPRYKFYGASSRSGFDAAYHFGSGKIRFLWHGR